MNVKLHASRIGEGPPVLLFHGLFGSGSNLGALARSLQDRYEVHSIDLPNHGRSQWLDNADLRSMATALRAWMDHHEVASASLVGHSLGGKVAMELALLEPGRVSSLVVADIAPVVYPAHHDKVFQALDAVVEAGCQSREEAASVMANYLRDEGVIPFLLMSLQRGPQGTYRWRFNVEGIKRGYQAVRAAPDPMPPYRGPVLFIKGGKSDYIREAHRQSIMTLFPHATLRVMPGCGHWLHAEQPSLFNSIAGRFLDAETS